MTNLNLILKVLALACFVGAAIGAASRINLVALGLAFATVSLLLA